METMASPRFTTTAVEGDVAGSRMMAAEVDSEVEVDLVATDVDAAVAVVVETFAVVLEVASVGDAAGKVVASHNNSGTRCSGHRCEGSVGFSKFFFWSLPSPY